MPKTKSTLCKDGTEQSRKTKTRQETGKVGPFWITQELLEAYSGYAMLCTRPEFASQNSKPDKLFDKTGRDFLRPVVDGGL